ncbi:MAG: flagellin [Planctomycetota bacterium]|jgi:flagellin
MITPVATTPLMRAQNALRHNQAALFRTINRLATGRRINAGRDDPAGLIASERLNAEIKTLEAETRGLQRANAYANITEGHTSQLSTLMRDLDGLVVASANQAGMSDAEIAANQMRIDSISDSIDRIRNDAVTSLGGFNMPDDGNAEVEDLIDSAGAAVSSLRSGGVNSLDSGNYEAAQTAIKGAIDDVATARGRIGAYQRYTVEPRVRSNQIAIENLSDARSRIADTDFAVESSNLIRFSILTASSVKVLKIAQQQGNSVLALLR